MNIRLPRQATKNPLRINTQGNIEDVTDKRFSFVHNSSEISNSDWPTCLMCKRPLPREIRFTGLHHQSCPWNYFIECDNCGYNINLSKLLGFWQGCSSKCRIEYNNKKRIHFQRNDITTNKNTPTVRTYVRKKYSITTSNDKHPPHNKPIFCNNNLHGGLLF